MQARLPHLPSRHAGSTNLTVPFTPLSKGSIMSRATGCVFSRVISQGDAEDRAAVMALVTSTKTHVDVAREMTGAGVFMSEHTVRRHRKADCTCALVAA